MKIVFMNLAFIIMALLPSQAEDSISVPNQIQRVKELVEKISSYRSQGKINITYTPEFLNLLGINPANNKKLFLYNAVSKENNIKLELKEINANGVQLEYINHYLTSKGYSRLGSDGTAFISSDIKGPDEANMNDFLGPFLGFSFLIQPVTTYGFRPVTPSTLKNVSAWDMVLDPTKAKLELTKEGQILISYQIGDNRWEIVFSKSAVGNIFLPHEIKFYTKEAGVESISRHLIINQYQADSKMNFVPEKLTLETYVAKAHEQGSFLGATFDFTIEKTEINPEIDDSLFLFDPSAARRIWDADKKLFIEIPR